MQEDKEPLFDTIDVLKASIEIYSAMLPTMKFNKDRMYHATTVGFLNATDFADYLVSKGLSFREAHECAGKAVSFALSRNKEIHELSLKDLKVFSSLVEKEVYDLLTPEEMVKRRKTTGGTAPEKVVKAIENAEKEIESEWVGLGKGISV